MLEIRDLVKTYKSKGGTEIHALDGVSIRFEETGMVFLVGKSGSGKSTLLNMCGGLDTPDSGEVVIKGRSSKDFTQSDFDSYRNTLVGFVFQEYNILEEFTVAENISLALELQGQSKNRAQVEEILREVDLAGYADRKPNTLSGGERQRIAIARALVKKPEIIMADEPTGALDSKTGKQVFETLKRLSKEKLVIVVSHDMEFAETYGDRIIELKDGKIISDLSRTQTAPEETITLGDDHTILVRQGVALTAENIKQLNELLQQNPAMKIAADERKPQSAFAATDERLIEEKTYSPEESAFIRSRLPLRHAFRMGASSMRIKPARLIITILLTFVAFAIFGLFSTMTFFNRKNVEMKSYLDLGYDMVALNNNYRYSFDVIEDGETQYTVDTYRGCRFSEEDVVSMREQYNDAILAVYASFSFLPANVNSTAYPYGATDRFDSYFRPSFNVASFDAGSDYWQEQLLTETDLSALGAYDIIISSYTFDSWKALGLFEDDAHTRPVALNNYADAVGKTLSIHSVQGSIVIDITFTIRGVYRYDLPERYDAARECGISEAAIRDPSFPVDDLRRELISFGYYSTALVSPSFYETISALFAAPAQSAAVPTDVWYSPETTNFRNTASHRFSAMLVPTDIPRNTLQSIVRGQEIVNEADDTFYLTDSLVNYNLSEAEYFILTLRPFFLIAGIVLALFSMLLLFNIISVSITHKKKEIGILRAVGARSTDVFRIFFSESAIITIICYILAVIASYIVCAVINSILIASFSVSALVFGPLSWLVMLAIAVGTSFIATFLPVYSIAKRKPVESIRSL